MSAKHDPYDHNSIDAEWVKSPFSADDNGSCVIIARFDNGDVWLGDDKDPSRPHLAFNRSEWTAFVQAIEARDPRFTA
ncbi:DUF397 domain-containing protein [Kitasatospora cathayae]|uniref:DUF397 domain-containing protein n=1 Tax=Kitasatospora cathayae TaxID=3004092 RepID=A0ABY7QBA9_9ACTN|nr:DUF397 domain-containing protein [Kitasatospora sp. HUAS 3-15]WBP89937.1 DUF397 domain-containing protein [Kitasatospora sp. HUAS 3-15]